MTKIIDVQNISKKYLINHEQRPVYGTLRDAILNRWRSWFSQKSLFTQNSETFWALQNLTFSINEGDRLGIIGKNGSGKSTLLKILARITHPTTGTVKIRGRVCSLLEVGTGFHPELTGRENIFLNGAILGMTKKEMRNKFDEIVAFSSIEKFLDTPVKRYSSGMYMRLGFAIAAHVDPDILIIDEVLAVGDAQFQAKCLKKLNSLSSTGRTVLFVSHDIGSLLTLCNKGLYLESGQLKEIGSIDQCINSYMQQRTSYGLSWNGIEGDEHIQFYRVSITSEGSDPREFFYQGEKVTFTMEYEVLQPIPDLIVGLGIWNQRNQLLARAHSLDNCETQQLFVTAGHHKTSFTFDAALFHEGEYFIKLDCFIHNRKHILNDHIMLKFAVYPRKKNTRFINCGGIEGISLGNQWQIKEVHPKT